MRSSAGIVAGLLLFGLVANCGGSDSNGGGTTAGTSATSAGQGGEPGAGGQPTAGKTSAGSNTGGSIALGGEPPTAGMGGTPETGCTTNADCGADAKCVGTVCKKNDGQACNTAANCQNACIDGMCTSKLADGKDCTSDDDCAHTCIDAVCAPASDLGGDCDVDLGAGGAGGAGGVSGGGAGNSSGGNAGESGAGGAGPLPQARDCQAPLQCFAGKCLTPDKQACKDNIDCISQACNKSVCEPKQGLNGPCDDKTDCLNASFVCDATTSTCKLDLKQKCGADSECQSTRCICSDSSCVTRSCKTLTSVCQCRWSPQDSDTCNNSSAALTFGVQDPNGCDVSSANVCDGAGQCVPNQAGDCSQQCQKITNGVDGKPNTGDEVCGEFGAATGCNTGYHSEAAPNGNCQPTATKAYKADGVTFDHYDYPCKAVCACNPNH